MRAMTSHRPHKWAKWLALAEWWYNCDYHSAIKMTPFEALYGVQPRQMCLKPASTSIVGVVEEFQVQREAMNQFLKESIAVAQNKYKQFADKKRREATLEVGDWVFLRLRPYRQLSVAVRKNMKLAHKYFGPYQVTEKIGEVAYRLKLPEGSKVHPVFHISLLKKKIGSHFTATTSLPHLGHEGQFLAYPVKVLQRRSIKRSNAAVVHWLVQWSNAILEDATWEDARTVMQQYPDFNPNIDP